ncbi:MAG: sodium-independent anion transporter [Candidatus Lindowbacteria bacterium]|nr:sodium-independent anion transporter [Candidatus Lindowbacteria bacterium]
MAKEAKKKECVTHAIAGRFDSKTATSLLEILGPKLSDDSVPGAVLDFSSASHITASGMMGLKWLVDQLQSNGKKVVLTGMRSEMYKALKVAGFSDALSFSHRTAPPTTR